MSAEDLHRWDIPVMINDLLELSFASSRIDLLVPILDLRGRLEDLALDLHYSYLRPRFWESEECGHASKQIYCLLKDMRAFAERSVEERCPEMRCHAASIVDGWLLDLEIISRASEAFDIVRFSRGDFQKLKKGTDEVAPLDTSNSAPRPPPEGPPPAKPGSALQ